MMGQAWPRPGIVVCQRMFSPVATFQVTGAGRSETPQALGPRNCGQFTVAAAEALWQTSEAIHGTAQANLRSEKSGGGKFIIKLSLGSERTEALGLRSRLRSRLRFTDGGAKEPMMAAGGLAPSL